MLFLIINRDWETRPKDEMTRNSLPKTSQELRMLSSVTLNCQVTKIVMNKGSQLSELLSVSHMPNCQTDKRITKLSKIVKIVTKYQIVKIVIKCQIINNQKSSLSKFSRLS